MKAAIVRAYGTKVEVADIAQPALLDDSLMIEVHAASVNPVDNLIRAGYLKAMMPLPLPYVVGNDVSGVVTAVGKDVSGFKVGDAVFARPQGMQSGTFAEFAMIKATDAALKPANLSHEQAASLPLVALTAWQALVTKGHLQSGQKVLIHAGSGGVGSIAIQLAKHLGATVATTTSSDNVAMVRALGADVVIDYKSQKFEDVVADYDLVFDTLGGATRERSYAVLKKGGSLISIILPADTSGAAEKAGVKSEAFFMWPSGEQLAQIARLAEQGAIKPQIDKVFTLEQSQEAFDYSQSGRAKGKIVVKVR
ncbi:NADP-dependent oxidoreductase [Caenimonas koreensis]|uniref:Zinc-binding dehydrogenase n=1 Tax=Caenimonas koreensis DSM 17982 TaxID=1121255 RepID=A0A844B934_9BURK|nr:NADP-dependent oxidoreductase [Caenimonas koreensis]MRD47987.1 zinc-binding dehydrogenase [Caenimonas koreensis DSM 17982]